MSLTGRQSCPFWQGCLDSWTAPSPAGQDQAFIEAISADDE
jgi:hypothetical protein